MIGLCKLCQVADFDALRDDIVRVFPDMPASDRPRRKVWEVVQAVRALLPATASGYPRILFVGAGSEHTVFYLSNYAEVHATDMYLRGGWSNWAPPEMLINPVQFADGPCNPENIIVQHMDGRHLRYPDGWFSAVICTSSIEHFGEWTDVQQAAREMARVCRRGGRVVITTEFEVNGKAGRFNENGLVFNLDTLHHHITAPSGCALVQPLDLMFTDADRATGQDLDHIMDLERQGLPVPMPHILLRQNGYEFTSVSLVLEKS